MAKQRVRIDVLLTERGLAQSRERAQALLMAGLVQVDHKKVDKAGTRVAPDAEIVVRRPDHPYVSRGGLKIEAALDAFHVDPSGRVALDIGASTGGFTDCLLQRGARKVYAVDVGHGQLAWRIRQHPAVVVIERTNARTWDGAELDESVSLVVVDVSFISLRLILPTIQRLAPKAEILALVKPQFEVGRENVGKGGVVREDALREAAAADVSAAADALGYDAVGLIDCPIHGPKGNRELLLHLVPVPIPVPRD